MNAITIAALAIPSSVDIAPETRTAIARAIEKIGQPAPVTIEAEYIAAGAKIKAAKALGREIEQARSQAKAPVTALGKRLDALAAELAAPVTQLAAGWEASYMAYQRQVEEARRAAERAEAARREAEERERQRQEAAERQRQQESARQAEAARVAGLPPPLPLETPPVIDPPMAPRPVILPPPALPKAATVVETLEHAVPDIDAVHRAFCTPDPVKINAYAREHKATIMDMCRESTDGTATIHGVVFSIRRAVRA